jgi:adenylate kinase family enzyme
MQSVDKNFLLIISGSVGAGKTTTGRILKQHFTRTAVFDMDDIKWQISDFKRGEDNAIVREGVFSLARNYCKHRINIIIPQTILLEEPGKFKELAKEFGYTYIQVELYANDDVVMERVLEKQKDSPNPSPKERILRNIAWYKKTTDPEVELLDTSNLKIEDVVNFVLGKIFEKIKT